MVAVPALSQVVWKLTKWVRHDLQYDLQQVMSYYEFSCGPDNELLQPYNLKLVKTVCVLPGISFYFLLNFSGFF